MLKSNKKSRKTRSGKFPLTLHKTGQYCKKIKGKLFYFGVDKKKALQSYLEQASYLHSGKPPVNNDTKSVSIKTLANRYLDEFTRECLASDDGRLFAPIISWHRPVSS